MKKKSWKTTAAGLVAALGVALKSQMPEFAAIGNILEMAGVFLVGVFARDNNVSSEEAGAK